MGFFNNNFKGNLQYLSESIIEVPRSVTKPLEDRVFATFDEIEKTEGINPMRKYLNWTDREDRISEVSIHELDFTGTKYSELGVVPVQLKIEFGVPPELSREKVPNGTYHNREDVYDNKDRSRYSQMTIPFPLDEGSVLDSIEHETIHLIQEEFAERGTQYGWSLKKSAKSNMHGDDLTNPYSWTGHPNRLDYNKHPVELQPSITNITNRLKRSYSKSDQRLSKKDFMLQYINDDQTYRIMTKDNPDNKRVVLKKVYDSFVNDL